VSKGKRKRRGAGSGTGTSTGNDTKVGAGAGAGGDTGSDIGTNAVADAATNTSANASANASPNAGADTAADAGTNTGTDAGARSPQGALARVWPLYLLVPIWLIGSLIGGYMAWHHEKSVYSEDTAEIWGCEESAEINCDVVNTSEFSELAGIPVGLLAIPTYLTLILLVMWALRRKERTAMGYAFAISLATVLYSLFLLYISKARLNFVCAWCLRLYLINTAAMILTATAAGGNPLKLLGETLRDLTRWPPAMKAAGGVFGATLLLSVGVQQAYRSSLGGDKPVPEALKKAKKQARPKTATSRGTLTAMQWETIPEDKDARATGKKGLLKVHPDDAWKGNADAKVVLVELGDFECPYCKQIAGEMSRLYDAYGDKVLFVFQHYPLNKTCNPAARSTKHRDACQAARASVCAQKQGKFWEYHDLLYKNQHRLDDAALKLYARELELDLDGFGRCLSSRESIQKVVQNARDAKSLALRGTPRIFLNGTLQPGRSAPALARAIEEVLGTDAGEARAAAKALVKRGPKIKPIPKDVPAMQEIQYGDLHFMIDTFEASLEEDKAISAQGKVPANGLSWFDAQEVCGAVGKRLCTEKEWVAACQGAFPVDDNDDGYYADDMIEGQSYPYSEYHIPRRCWDGSWYNTRSKEGYEEMKAARPIYTGSMPGCVSVDGVYDLTGNVEEWVGASKDEAVLLGGAFNTSRDNARCYRRNDTFGPGYSAGRNGVRCCQSIP